MTENLPQFPAIMLGEQYPFIDYFEHLKPLK